MIESSAVTLSVVVRVKREKREMMSNIVSLRVLIYIVLYALTMMIDG